MENEIIIQRLAFAKYLIQKGNQEAHNSEPLSSVAILHYHDALELIFDLILEDIGIDSNNLSFIQQFDKVNDWLKSEREVEISLRPSLEKLKNRRVNLKHKGLFPSRRDIQESEFTSKTLFEELCNNVYGIDSDDISLINLIENERVANYLSESLEQYPVDQKISIGNISLAFEFLLRDYESSKTEEFRRSPFFFGQSMTFESSFHMRLNSRDPIAKFVDKTKESIEAIQKAIKILAFGFDYKKYIKFRLLIPEAIWYVGSEIPDVRISEDVEIEQSDFQFCINYVIECALKLQEFDFEVLRDEENGN